MTQGNKTTIIEVPLQGLLRIMQDSKGASYAQLTFADGSVVIIREAKDGFFDDNFTEVLKYGRQMSRLLRFLEEREKKQQEKSNEPAV